MTETKQATRVRVAVAAKINLGNFSNVTLEIEIDDYVRSNDGSTSNAIDRVYGLVDSHVADKVDELRKQLDSVREK